MSALAKQVIERLAYRPGEAAVAIGISRRRIYDLMDDGSIPYRQVGGVRLISRATLEDFLAERTVAS
jgi:excisionase family DNA binding protein